MILSYHTFPILSSPKLYLFSYKGVRTYVLIGTAVSFIGGLCGGDTFCPCATDSALARAGKMCAVCFAVFGSAHVVYLSFFDDTTIHPFWVNYNRQNKQKSQKNFVEIVY